jgi:hypothetical protein
VLRGRSCVVVEAGTADTAGIAGAAEAGTVGVVEAGAAGGVETSVGWRCCGFGKTGIDSGELQRQLGCRFPVPRAEIPRNTEIVGDGTEARVRSA